MAAMQEEDARALRFDGIDLTLEEDDVTAGGKRRRSGYGSGAKGRRRALERAMRHWEEVRPEDAARLRVRWEGGGTVSYTHLTLPTILLV